MKYYAYQNGLTFIVVPFKGEASKFTMIELEAEIHQQDADVYLHPFGVPLDEAIKSSERQTSMFDS